MGAQGQPKGGGGQAEEPLPGDRPTWRHVWFSGRLSPLTPEEEWSKRLLTKDVWGHGALCLSSAPPLPPSYP